MSRLDDERDSFITHRAFCDALTEESAKAIGINAMAAAPPHHALMFSPPPQSQPVMQQQQHQDLAAFQEVMQPQQQQHCNYAMKTEMPAWPAMPYDHHTHPLLQPLAQSSATSAPPPHTQQTQLPAAPAHLSATALLQKAAQMGATISSSVYATQMAGTAPTRSAPGSATFALGLPGLAAAHGQDGGSMGRRLARTASAHGRSGEDGGGGGGSDGMTRDFLGLRAFSHRDILNLAGFDSCIDAVSASAGMTCYEPQQQQHAQAAQHGQQQQQSSNEPWHGMGSHS